jgi:hypothetical protein
VTGIVAMTIGHRPAQPGPRQERLLAPRHPERQRRHDDRERPGQEGRGGADEQRVRQRGQQAVGEASRPSRTNSPASASSAVEPGEAEHARRCGSVELPRTSAAR